MGDAESSGEVSIDEEAEFGDALDWMETVTSKIQEIEAATECIKQGMQSIETVTSKIQEIEDATECIKQGMMRIVEFNRAQAILNSQREAETQLATLETSFNTEKLTPTSKRLISRLEGGPLDPGRFKEFLMGKIFGKPRPPALPIVRSYTDNVRGLCQQLREFRWSLKKAHREYMTTHKKDENLERRIQRLVENIEQELAVEERDGRQQTSMASFVVPLNGV